MWTAYTGLDVYSAYIRMTYLSDGSGSRCSWVENAVENVALVLHNPDALQPGRTRGFVAGTFLQISYPAASAAFAFLFGLNELAAPPPRPSELTGNIWFGICWSPYHYGN